MDRQELRVIIEEAVKATNPFSWWLYLVLALISGIAAFFGSYLKRKAENLATREDIAEITEKVEDVRTQYKERLENLAHQNRQILEQGTRRHQL